MASVDYHGAAPKKPPLTDPGVGEPQGAPSHPYLASKGKGAKAAASAASNAPNPRNPAAKPGDIPKGGPAVPKGSPSQPAK